VFKICLGKNPYNLNIIVTLNAENSKKIKYSTQFKYYKFLSLMIYSKITSLSIHAIIASIQREVT